MRKLDALLATLLLAPALSAQQLPLFTDGTAFGGSRLFSQGLNPLGNPARFSPRSGGQLPGFYGTYLTGGLEAVDFRKRLDAWVATPSEVTLKPLAEAPWGLRTTAVGLALLEEAGHLSLTRETTTSLLAGPDLDAARLGTGWPQNTSTLEVRRSMVERLVYGLVSVEGGTAMGLSLRVERWTLGQRVHGVHPAGSQLPLPVPGADPYDFEETSLRTTASTLDAGLTMELGTGLRIGVQADRLVPRTIQGVEEKTQVRAGLQLDLGQQARLSLEGDVNSAARMPYPVKQKALAASLVFQVNPSVTFRVGSERRTYGDLSTTRTGATLSIQTPGFVLGVGFQVGADQPLRGAMLRVY